MSQENYSYTYKNDGSYSGTDIKVYAIVNNTFGVTDSQIGEKQSSIYEELAELQTISYSIYRDKLAVKNLGNTNPTGFTRGHITIAGTMIFTVLHERILHEISSYSINNDSANGNKVEFKNLRIDQLPPLDIFITFENEMGSKSRMGIYGVEFMNEGQVMSVADLITENSVNFMARHISPMRRINGDELPETGLSTNSGMPMTSTEYDIARQQIKDIKARWL